MIRFQYINKNSCRIICLFLIFFIVTPVLAQISTTKLPITIDAESTDYEGEESILTFNKLKLSQGNISIIADSGQANKLDFENSVWQFKGNVKIILSNGEINAASTYLEFKGHQIRIAKITGSSEQQAILKLYREEKLGITKATADRIDYDFDAAMIDFSGNVSIVEDGNQISSSYLVYNINKQTIQAQSKNQNNPKVKITYTPRISDNEKPIQDNINSEIE
jgi:lipopolysaccharide transport protein LptA